VQVQRRQGEHRVWVEEGEHKERTKSEQGNYTRRNNKIGMVHEESEVSGKGQRRRLEQDLTEMDNPFIYLILF